MLKWILKQDRMYEVDSSGSVLEQAAGPCEHSSTFRVQKMCQVWLHDKLLASQGLCCTGFVTFQSHSHSTCPCRQIAYSLAYKTRSRSTDRCAEWIYPQNCHLSFYKMGLCSFLFHLMPLLTCTSIHVIFGPWLQIILRFPILDSAIM